MEHISASLRNSALKIDTVHVEYIQILSCEFYVYMMKGPRENINHAQLIILFMYIGCMPTMEHISASFRISALKIYTVHLPYIKLISEKFQVWVMQPCRENRNHAQFFIQEKLRNWRLI